MTDMRTFMANPWKSGALHPAYKSSFLHLKPAPEYSSGEVLVASLCRRLGLRVVEPGEKPPYQPLSEGGVPDRGRAFLQALEQGEHEGAPDPKLPLQSWRALVREGLASPKTPAQSKKDFVHMSPVVPLAAVIGMSARLTGNPWNPGALVERCLSYGVRDHGELQRLWDRLYHSVSIESDDDIWAKFLDTEFRGWIPSDVIWAGPTVLKDDRTLAGWRAEECRVPAQRLCRDVAHVIKAKSLLTRRQWLSLLEAVLRIGTSSHVMWLCRVNRELYRLSKSILRGDTDPSNVDLHACLGGESAAWRYGELARARVKSHSSDYVLGRLGMNLLLHACEDVPVIAAHLAADGLRSFDSISRFLTLLSEECSPEFVTNYVSLLEKAKESDPGQLALKKGSGKNVQEFLQHMLGQRETAVRSLVSYDQGYLLRRRGAYRRAPWIVSAGPAALIALVHCCCNDAGGVRTVEDLCVHLAAYGIDLRPNEVAESSLGSALRMQGLVLDSPDAEGGMVLVDPLPRRIKSGATA